MSTGGRYKMIDGKRVQVEAPTQPQERKPAEKKPAKNSRSKKD